MSRVSQGWTSIQDLWGPGLGRIGQAFFKEKQGNGSPLAPKVHGGTFFALEEGRKGFLHPDGGPRQGHERPEGAMKDLFILCEDPDLVKTLAHAAQRMGYRTRSFSTLDHLSEATTRHSPMIILLDLDSATARPELIQRTAQSTPHTPIIALSGRSFHPELADAFARHIRVCLRKPPDMEELSFWLRSFSR